MTRQSVPPCIGPGLVTRRLVVPAKEVVYVKGIVEAHEGLAQIFSDGGGDLLFSAPADRERELEELVHDLALELGALVSAS